MALDIFYFILILSNRQKKMKYTITLSSSSISDNFLSIARLSRFSVSDNVVLFPAWNIQLNIIIQLIVITVQIRFCSGEQ